MTIATDDLRSVVDHRPIQQKPLSFDEFLAQVLGVEQ
jgi:hypothetical protein